MKTLSRTPFKLMALADGEYVPERLEPGIFYHLPWVGGSAHLCACGCGEKCWLPIKDGEWTISDTIRLTVEPSIQQRFACSSHYVIVDGEARLLGASTLIKS